MSLNKQVIAGVKWTTIGTLSVTLSNVLKISVLARFLSKDDFGVFAIVIFFLGFFKMFSEMGLTTAILHKQDIKKNEYASLYWFNIIFCICLYLLLFLITPIISGFYNEPELDFLIKVLGLSIIINSIGLQFRTIETKNLSFKYISIFDIIASVISLSFAIWLAVNGYGILALVYSVVLQYTISNFLLFFLGLRNHGVRIYFRFKDLKPFLRIGLFQVGGQSANFFNRNLDILIIGKFFSQEVIQNTLPLSNIVKASHSFFELLLHKINFFREKTVMISATIPKVGSNTTYTSGWPKNQNKCCHNSGSPPPDGRKNEVPIL
mgnify:CR=1 FL=1